MPMGTADQNGVFEVVGVLPATYSLIVSGSVTGYMVVDATGGDVNNLQIAGVKGVDIPIRLTLEDGAGLVPVQTGVPFAPLFFGGPNGEPFRVSPPNTSLWVTLSREPGTGSPTGNFVITAGWPGIPPSTQSPQVQALPAGGYMLRGAALGNYRVSVAGLTPGSYVKSIRRGQVDVLRDGLRIAGPGTPTDDALEIAAGANAGVLTGRVLNDAGVAVPNVTVALVPNPQLRSRVELYQSVSTDSNGSFRFQGIVPDEYKLFAWEDVTPGAWHDADFLRPYENRGQVLNVRPGTNPPQDLKLIPWSGQ
jgi:hypothetical protein